MRESDVILLHRYADERDEQAFAEVVRRNMDVVYSAALRRTGGNTHLAEDVAQDVFVALAHHADRVCRYSVLTGWLFTATRNAAANRIRSEIRRQRREQEAQLMQEISSDESVDVRSSQIVPVLDSLLDELSETDRLALLLRFFERHSFAQLSEIFRVSEDAARMRVERALSKIRVRLERRGIHSSAAILAAAFAQQSTVAAPPGLLAATVKSVGTSSAASSAGLQSARTLRSFLPVERFSMIAAGLVIVAGIAVSVPATRAIRTTSISRESETAKLTDAEVRLAQLQSQLRDQIDVVTALQKEISQTRASIKKRNASPVPLVTPAGKAQVVRAAGGRRTQIAATYDSLYRSLHLSAEDIDRFENLCLSAPGLALWVSDLPTDERPGSSLSANEVEANLQALLGPRGYEDYRNYSRSVPARAVAAEVASSVYLTDPLNADQGEKLTRLLADASPSYRTGATVNLAELDWNTALATAATVLSSSQLQALSAVRAEEAYRHALHNRMAGKFSGESTSSP